MRGTDRESGKLFSYVSPESLVPQDHPLRATRALVNAALERLSPKFARIYAEEGRPSIAPERLLRALLLQAATESATFMARSAAMRHTPRRPIRTPGCTRSRPGRQTGCATWDMW
jgi:hypothetical protein